MQITHRIYEDGSRVSYAVERMFLKRPRPDRITLSAPAHWQVVKRSKTDGSCFTVAQIKNWTTVRDAEGRIVSINRKRPTQNNASKLKNALTRVAYLENALNKLGAEYVTPEPTPDMKYVDPMGDVKPEPEATVVNTIGLYDDLLD